MKSARGILEQAFEACQQSEEIWLAAVKLESECDELKRARQILAKARTSASSPRVMMKSAKLDWSLGDLKMALALLDEGKSKFKGVPHKILETVDHFHGHFRTQQGRLPQKTTKVHSDD